MFSLIKKNKIKIIKL